MRETFGRSVCGSEPVEAQTHRPFPNAVHVVELDQARSIPAGPVIVVETMTLEDC